MGDCEHRFAREDGDDYFYCVEGCGEVLTLEVMYGRMWKAEAEVERLREREAFLTERLQLIGNLTSRPVIVEMVRNSVGLKD